MKPIKYVLRVSACVKEARPLKAVDISNLEVTPPLKVTHELRVGDMVVVMPIPIGLQHEIERTLTRYVHVMLNDIGNNKDTAYISSTLNMLVKEDE